MERACSAQPLYSKGEGGVGSGILRHRKDAGGGPSACVELIELYSRNDYALLCSSSSGPLGAADCNDNLHGRIDSSCASCMRSFDISSHACR